MPAHVHKPRALSRLDVQRRRDRPTNSVVLVFTGRGLSFHDSIYGYPSGTFAVVSYDELPFPPDLQETSAEVGVPIEALAISKELREAAVDAIMAEAMVKAPQMLHEFSAPRVEWKPWDLRELERRHVIALARVVELTALAERELRLRAAKVQIDPGALPVAAFLPPSALVDVPARPAPEVTEPHSASRPEPTAMVLGRVEAAIAQARQVELAQRLPNGARRALQKLVRAQYVVKDSESPVVRGSLAEAMRDAETIAAASAKGVEVSVIDWDGEWPVVVRRYGDGGRTIYRVEEALRRAASEERAA